GAQPIAQNRDAFGEDARESDLVERLRRVGEPAVRLHAEAKARRCLAGPLAKSRLGRRAVEAAVELDATEALRVVAEHLRAAQRARVELPFPGVVAEAGRAGEQHR